MYGKSRRKGERQRIRTSLRKRISLDIEIPKSAMNLPLQTSLRRVAVAYYGEAHTHVEELEEVVSEGGISTCVMR